MTESKISKIWWLWIPVIMLAMQFCIEFAFDAKTLSIMHSENGPHEFAQFVIMVAAFILATFIFVRMKKRENPWLAGWIGIAALAGFYVAGEEVSWGQHFMSWTTPEFWQEVNDQEETNLHNTSSWLDQKPRLVLEIGVIVGGLLIPALEKFKKEWLPARFTIIYPPAFLAVTAGGFFALKVIDKISDEFSLSLFERVSEVQELYLFYFVLLYLVVMRARIFSG